MAVGYLTYLKTMLVEALKVTFDEVYPEAEWQGLYSSIEYPVEEAHYPGVWVDYDDVDDLQIVGVDHHEYLPWGEGNFMPLTRWKFSGYVTYTITALTSLERDRIYDELVTVLAFGEYDPARRRFRDFIEVNDFIAAIFNFDKISPKGSVAAPGTPWGTDEILYERSISVGVIGEFVPHPVNGELVPLSSIIVTPIMVLNPADEGEIPLSSGEPGIILAASQSGEVPVTTGDLVTDWH